MNRIEETSATLKSRFTNVDKAKHLLNAIDNLLSDMGYEGEYSLSCFDDREVYGKDSARYHLMVDIYEKGNHRRLKR